MDRIYLSYKLQAEELVDWSGSLLSFLKSPMVSFICLGVAIAAHTLWAYSLHLYSFVDLAVLGGIFVIFFTCLHFSMLRFCQVMHSMVISFRRRNFVKAGYDGIGRGYIFQEDKWVEIFDGRAFDLAWSQITGWSVSERCIILKVGRVRVPIPKRACSDEQKAALEDFLTRLVGSRYDGIWG